MEDMESRYERVDWIPRKLGGHEETVMAFGNVSTAVYHRFFVPEINNEVIKFKNNEALCTAVPTKFSRTGHEVYMNPEHSILPSIRDTRLTEVLRKARQTRTTVNRALAVVATCLDTLPYRIILDSLSDMDPTKHHFYFHCLYFRLIKKEEPVAQQGFNVECLHSHSIEDEPPVTYRGPPAPAFLFPEEDLFLHFATELFELAGHLEAANAIRGFRGAPVLFAEEVYKLLRGGFLDPLEFFDRYGVRKTLRTVELF